MTHYTSMVTHLGSTSLGLPLNKSTFHTSPFRTYPLLFINHSTNSRKSHLAWNIIDRRGSRVVSVSPLKSNSSVTFLHSPHSRSSSLRSRSAHLPWNIPGIWDSWTSKWFSFELACNVLTHSFQQIITQKYDKHDFLSQISPYTSHKRFSNSFLLHHTTPILIPMAGIPPKHPYLGA